MSRRRGSHGLAVLGGGAVTDMSEYLILNASKSNTIELESGNVRRWTNTGSAGGKAIQLVAANQPLHNIDYLGAGKHGVDFDGSGDHLDIDYTDINLGYSLFICLEADALATATPINCDSGDSQSRWAMFIQGNGAVQSRTTEDGAADIIGRLSGTGEIVATVPEVFSFHYDGKLLSVGCPIFNQAAPPVAIDISSAEAGTFDGVPLGSTLPIRLGDRSSGSTPYNGKIFEIRKFARMVTPAERANITAEMVSFWGT